MGTRISIIGGGGLVGSCTGFALQARGTGSEIVLLDVNPEVAAGQALDLLHGSPLMSDQKFRAGDNSDIADSDIICITAGLRRKPDESRLDLVNRNTQLFRSILENIKAAGTKSCAIVLVVSNPVDILTRLAAQELDLPANQVIGLGTQLDTIRFRGLIASELGIAPSQVSALILGEHGDSMLPVWSSATIGGLPIDKFPAFNNASFANQIFERTKKSGAEVIAKKGGAGFAVGVAIADVMTSIVKDEQRILPVSSVQSGCYGIRDVALSVPTVVGNSGVVRHLQIELWPKENMQLRNSANSLDDFWKSLKI